MYFKKTIFILTIIYFSFSLSAAELTDVQKLIWDNKGELPGDCISAAVTHCGKMTRSFSINEEELACLHKVSTRVTRDMHPMDSTACSEAIKKMDIVANHQLNSQDGPDDLTKVQELIWDKRGELPGDCISEAVKHCDKMTRSYSINKKEFACLHKISTRLTRDIHPMDSSACSESIKKLDIIASAQQEDSQNSENSNSQDVGCSGGILSADKSNIFCPNGDTYTLAGPTNDSPRGISRSVFDVIDRYEEPSNSNSSGTINQ